MRLYQLRATSRSLLCQSDPALFLVAAFVKEEIRENRGADLSHALCALVRSNRVTFFERRMGGILTSNLIFVHRPPNPSQSR
mmetsp:Transcript_829/g.1742  ORF Transcript_829/g.1742 Transcript_829/m.1742 type:complete len:82 (+) Transcript_829:520-765(+)